MPDGPLSAYRAKLAQGDLAPDPVQELAAEKLQSLHHALRGYQPSSGKAGWKERFGLSRRRDSRPQGLYIFGDVGRGKSMLMDLFFESAPVERKRRIHFQALMRDVHDDIHKWRKAPRRAGEDDPLPPRAEAIAEAAWLLCIDELEVRDIADAMIVGRLFQEIMARGVVLVITSNRAPQDLYKDGLQREKFLPFIDLIRQDLDVLELNSARDYRLSKIKGMTVYHTPLDAAAATALDEAFARLTDGETPAPAAITVKGRDIPVPLAAGGVARFGFKDLCETPLGSADYMKIATRYHTLIVSDIPRLGPNRESAARRFVTLVDALYEHRVTLICSAAAPPEDLYTEGKGAFEFHRTVSRLMEMQAEGYIGGPHLA